MKKNIFSLIVIAGLTALPACSRASAPHVKQSVQTVKQDMKVTHVDAVQAKAMMTARPDLVIVDVRTPGEFNAGHIKGAINIDYRSHDFAASLSQLDANKDYLIHCRSGGRSTSSLAVFKQAGFSHIIHMDGGINGWHRASLPTVN